MCVQVKGGLCGCECVGGSVQMCVSWGGGGGAVHVGVGEGKRSVGVGVERSVHMGGRSYVGVGLGGRFVQVGWVVSEGVWGEGGQGWGGEKTHVCTYCVCAYNMHELPPNFLLDKNKTNKTSEHLLFLKMCQIISSNTCW